MAAGKKNKNMLVRHNTIRLFDEHLAERILYVCAPAGYGKTVAVMQWLEKDKRSKACIATGDYSSGVILLQKTLTLAMAYHRPLDSIEARILLAIAYRKKKRGFQADALLHLEAALALAYPYGYTQMFIKEGAELEGLLQKLLRRASQKKSESKVPADFINMICMKSRESVGAGMAVPARAEAVKFTEKQMTVMRLLRDGKNYREIAELMNIKPTTLRSHIRLIYTKLDVTNVQDAVERIRVNRILEQ